MSEAVLLNKFIPVDKSSAVRAFLFSLLTESEMKIVCSGELPEDAVSALNCLKLFGKTVVKTNNGFIVSGKTLKPGSAVFCGNSATMMHILMGIGIYLGFSIELTGDKSLMSRNHSDFYEAADLYHKGEFVETSLAKESAQLKSFHIISMLKTGGTIHFKARTRRNTEDFLSNMGAKIIETTEKIEVAPSESLHGCRLNLRKDPSAAFIAACAAFILGKSFVISDIYLDESRMTPFVLLKNAGYHVTFTKSGGAFTVSGHPDLSENERDLEISGTQVAEVIDEIPFMAFMAARAGKRFSVRNAEWLRNKETDRITESLKRLSVFFETEEFADGFAVGAGKPDYQAAVLPHSQDHRMEMLSALMASDYGIDFEMNCSYKISFPLFYELLDFLRKNG